jgi:SAM-dependent methyltransferase
MIQPHFTERKSCPCCRSPKSRELYSSPFDAAPVKEYLEAFYAPQGGVEFQYLQAACYVLAECQDCGLIFQRQILNDLLMAKLYGCWIDPAKVRYQESLETGTARSAGHAREIAGIIGLLRRSPASLRLFDFGMGWGQWALMAKAFGCDSYGFELCSERIEAARFGGIKIVGWDEIPRQQFDFINTEQVLEHVPEPLETILHLKKALKPGGLLKISVPSAHNMARRLKRMDWQAPKWSRYSLNPVAPLEHINFFRSSSLLTLAQIAELKPVSAPFCMKYRCSGIRHWLRSLAKELLYPDNYLLLEKP